MRESALRRSIEKICYRVRIVADSGAAADSEEVKQVLDDLLEIARNSSLKGRLLDTLSAALDELHERLGLPGYDLADEADEHLFDGGNTALERKLEALGSVRGLVLYSLPEVGRIDKSLLPRLVLPLTPGLRESWAGVTIAARASLPLHPPAHDGGVGFEWRTPTIRYDNSVLQIEQISKYRDYDHISIQRSLCAIYRVKGHLVHARGAMLYEDRDR